MTEQPDRRGRTEGPDRLGRSRPAGGAPAPDPLGKRALFWAQPDAGHRRQAPPLGKHALFSNAGSEAGERPEDPLEHPLDRRGPVTVECSRCKVVTRIGFLDLLMFQFPVGYWLPRPKFDHRMTCPACRRRTWASVTLRHR